MVLGGNFVYIEYVQSHVHLPYWIGDSISCQISSENRMLLSFEGDNGNKLSKNLRLSLVILWYYMHTWEGIL